MGEYVMARLYMIELETPVSPKLASFSNDSKYYVGGKSPMIIEVLVGSAKLKSLYNPPSKRMVALFASPSTNGVINHNYNVLPV